MPRTSIDALENNITGPGQDGLSMEYNGTVTLNGTTPVFVSQMLYQLGDVVQFGLRSVGGTPGQLPYVTLGVAQAGFYVAGTSGDISTYSYMVHTPMGQMGEVGVPGPTQPALWNPSLLTGYNFYTDGSYANTTSGTVTSLAMLNRRTSMVGVNGPTISGGVMTFNGTNTFLTAEQAQYTATYDPLFTYDLPAASGSGPNGGYTCTGICYLPNGLIATGNDGRGKQGDGSTNINASIVILDTTANKVAEVTLLSMGIATTTGSVQGLAYVIPTNQIAFVVTDAVNGTVHLLNATTYAYEGQWTVGGTISGLNGLAYHPGYDALVTLNIADAFVVYRSFTTGAQLFTKPITQDINNNDMLFWDQERGEMVVTKGQNGLAGHYIARSSNVGDAMDITMTGVIATEGMMRVGNRIYALSDAGYHSVGNNKNQMLVYDASNLPVVDAWKWGYNIQLSGIISMPSAQGSTRIYGGVGNSLSATGGGYALAAPSGSTTTLRLIENNNTSAEWTNSPALTTKHIFYVTVDFQGLTSEMWVDSVSLGTKTLTPNVSTIVTDGCAPSIGAGRIPNLFVNGNITCWGGTVGELGSRQKMEGYMAWQTGNTALLPVDHPYKNNPPYVS